MGEEAGAGGAGRVGGVGWGKWLGRGLFTRGGAGRPPS